MKVPLFPLHTWLPDAHTQAPTAGSVILAGVMLKLGTYGFVRFGLYLFPEAAVYFAPALVTLGVIGIIYGAVVATMQKDLKRLVAYSSVAHLGFIVLGTFALTTQGIQGGVVQMVNHGISTGALFLLVGMIYERRHTREIAALKGLQKSAPILAGVFTVVMLSSIGLPGLNGFVGEFLILVGSFLTRRWWTVVAAAGVILAALYLLWAYQRVFHGEPDEDNADDARPDLARGPGDGARSSGSSCSSACTRKPMLERIEPSVDRLVAHIEDHSDYERARGRHRRRRRRADDAEHAEEERRDAAPSLAPAARATTRCRSTASTSPGRRSRRCSSSSAARSLLLAVDSLSPRRPRRGHLRPGHRRRPPASAIVAAVPLWQRVQDDDRGPFSTLGQAVGVDGFSVFVTFVICAARDPRRAAARRLAAPRGASTAPSPTSSCCCRRRAA